jgi:dipeptidyl aminopeptidase/acylaminoacyl peptidase
MGWGRLVAGFFFVVFSTASAHGAALNAYGELPSLEHFAVSPDGTKLAYATFVKGQRTILINSVDAGKVIGGFAVDQKLRAISWADNDHVLATVSLTRTVVGTIGTHAERWMVQSYSLAAQKAVVLLEHGAYQMNIVADVPLPRMIEGHSVAYLEGFTFVDQSGVEALFVEDLQSGRLNHIVETGSPKYWIDWLIDEKGAIIARTTYDDESGRWVLQIKHGAGYTDAFETHSPIDQPWVLGITPDGKSILIVTPGYDGSSLKQFSLADNSPQAAPDLPADDIFPVEDPATHRLIGIGTSGISTQYRFFDAGDQNAWNGLAHAFPGENVELVSWSNDRKVVVARVDGKRDGASYFLIDLNTHKANFLGSVYAGIDVPDLSEKTLITYTAADGTKIPAFLTLPNGRAPKNLPLVVVPHGGPASHDDAQFDWLSQSLAAQGYAVLQPEFRGSDGSGWLYLAAGFGQWGRKMQTDLSDGVRYLVSQGVIDAKRVCIVGASYGGYAALAGATLDRGVYRCAVSDSGVSDPHDFLKWSQDRAHKSDSSVLRYWARFMGGENLDDPRLTEISPLHHAADANIPILLIHGKDDTVVPIDQSEEMETALKAAGKPVTLVKLEREDHWLSTSDTRLQMLQATVAFLQANNPAN